MPGVNPVPEGYRTCNMHLVAKDTAKAIEWYGRAFGAETVMVMPGPGGGIMHAELKIGDTMLMIADEWPGMPQKAPSTVGNSTTVVLALYVPDCDAVFQKVVQAGATPLMPPSNMFWGDRYGQIQDPAGHVWAIATHFEDVSPEECARRAAEWMKSMSGGCEGHGHDH